MAEIKEPTVLDASVGADAEQSTILDKNSITQFCTNEAVSEKFSMAMDGDIGSLPEEIRKNGKFCVWRFENVGERKSKVPYRAGRQKCHGSLENQGFHFLCTTFK